MNAGRSMKLRTPLLLLLLQLVIHLHAGTCFSLFGSSAREFSKGDLLVVKVDKLTSTNTQIPYAYYSVPFCPADTHAIIDNADYFDGVFGNRPEISPYTFNMLEPLTCKVVCRTTLDAKSAMAFEERIADDYRVNMILDELPVATKIRIISEGINDYYQPGFQIGLRGQYAGSDDYKYFIYNHLDFTVKYHKDAQANTAKIVGFEVRPFSVNHEYEGNKNTTSTTCKSPVTEKYSNGPQQVQDKEEIIFTYDVVFQESNITWASRWDPYLQPRTQGPKPDWYAATNSVVNILFFLAVAAMILMRTYRDICNYNESLEETGWKLIHSDVFRPPPYSDLLCIFAGTGVQCFGTMIIIIIFSLLGFTTSSNWGQLWKPILLLWILMGYFSGYTSARLYKRFKGTKCWKIAFKTATTFPAPVAVILLILNTLTRSQKSSIALILFWFGVSVPLVFIGFFVGFRKQAVEDDLIRTSKIPREIPHQIWYKNPITSILVGGILPFGVVFYELVLILASIWFHQFNSINAFHLFTFLALLATCAGTTIVVCYLQLCREDYRWWWTSYLTSGFSGVYMFVYAAYFFATRMYIEKPVPVLVYFSYMLIGSYAFFMLTGTVGFYVCFWFTRLIYSSLKID